MMVQCLEMPAQMYSHFTLVMGLMNQRILIEKATKIGEDLWKQMKRVSTLVFYGDKKMYQNSKAAFAACMDQSPATEKYRSPQLCQYLWRSTQSY